MSQVNLNTDPMRDRLVPTNRVDMPCANSAVSWAAIFAGAAGAAALSLLLMILGTGLGFSAVSPWRMEGISATTFGIAAILWLSFTQLAASGMGGYLAGRLRTKWTDVHTDEVYFRDTAHGFLTWAIASLLTAALLTSVMGSIGSGVRAGAEVVSETAGAVAGTAAGSAAMLSAQGTDAKEQDSSLGYFIDSLFRADNGNSADNAPPQANSSLQDPLAEQATPQANKPAAEILAGREAPPVNELVPEVMPETVTPQTNTQSASMTNQQYGEVTRVFARALYAGSLPQEDQSYIAQLIAQRTSLSQQEAEQRVSEGFEKLQTMLKNAETTARETADEARKASAYAALWMAIALLLGAFVASLMAVYGGRQRDA